VADSFGREVDVSFDDELRRAFKRKEPPPGFAERVLARISQAGSSVGETRCATRVGSAFVVRWIAAAAAGVAIAIASTQIYHSRQAALEEARVKQQLRTSLQIASEKLNDVERKLREHSLREF
jgi:hypothetical protein